jgi:hypothetical protein
MVKVKAMDCAFTFGGQITARLFARSKTIELWL